MVTVLFEKRIRVLYDVSDTHRPYLVPRVGLVNGLMVNRNKLY